MIAKYFRHSNIKHIIPANLLLKPITKFRMSRIGSFAIASLILFLLWGCVSVPYTGRSRILLTSVSEENSLGEEAWKNILSTEHVSNNGLYNSVLKDCGTYLSRVTDRPDFRWEFRVLENPAVNAFCLPGGKVAVYTGLFEATANEAELAAIVGHEIGHAIARHGGERMTQQLVQQIGSEALKTSLGIDGARMEALLAAYAGISNVGFILPYSRVHEYEADKIGMILMSKAGYDPRAALDFWERMTSKQGDGSSFSEFLSTHPINNNRIKAMKDFLPEAQKLYQSAALKREKGRKISNYPKLSSWPHLPQIRGSKMKL